MENKKVAVIMGSDSDFPIVKDAVKELKAYGVPYEVHVMSAHRTPELASEFAEKLKEEGILVSAIRPPSVPEGESRLRLTIIATHTIEEIEHTAQTIIKIWNNIKA